MRRREFITLLGGVAVTAPLTAQAQQSDKLPRIGSIQSENSEAFFQGLREAGYLDGQNARYAIGAADAVDKFAGDLVALNCAVIFASNPYAHNGLGPLGPPTADQRQRLAQSWP